MAISWGRSERLARRRRRGGSACAEPLSRGRANQLLTQLVNNYHGASIGLPSQAPSACRARDIRHHGRPIGRLASRQTSTVSQTARVPSMTTWTRVPGSANAEPAPDTWADTSVSSTSRRVVTTEVAPWNVRLTTVPGIPPFSPAESRTSSGRTSRLIDSPRSRVLASGTATASSCDLHAVTFVDGGRKLVHRADEPGDERARRMAVHLARRRRAARAVPCDITPIRSEIAERLLLVVGDEQRRDAELGLDPADLVAQRRRAPWRRAPTAARRAAAPRAGRRAPWPARRVAADRPTAGAGSAWRDASAARARASPSTRVLALGLGDLAGAQPEVDVERHGRGSGTGCSSGTPCPCSACGPACARCRDRRRTPMPESANSNPAAMRSAVVFPQPDGPSRLISSPGSQVEVEALEGDGRRRTSCGSRCRRVRSSCRSRLRRPCDRRRGRPRPACG